VPARLQLVLHGLGNRRFGVQRLKPGDAAPPIRRSASSAPAARERGVQVGIPVLPELDDVEERLQDGLFWLSPPGVPSAMNGLPSLSTRLGVM
jgi:hypothetical protein